MKEEHREFFEIVCMSCMLLIMVIIIILGAIEAWEVAFG